MSSETTRMRWVESWRADPVARALADRHYNRQKVGAAQFVPPGACNVLRTPAGDALWITSRPYAEYVKHAWAGAWMCSAFRNESPHVSSELIVEAVAATRYLAGDPPPLGFVTFVDPAKTRRKRDPGRCFVRAGWTRLRERTKAGLIVLQLLPADFPEPRAPLGVLEMSA